MAIENIFGGVCVLHVARGVGPTSMPWNDLYATARELAPGMMYPPLAVGFRRTGAMTIEPCRGVNRRYFNGGFFTSFFYVSNIYKRSLNRRRKLVLHVHNPVLVVLALLLKIRHPYLVVYANLHNDWRHFKIHQRLSLRILANLSSRFITVSQAIVDSIPTRVRESLENSRRLISISNGINSTLICEARNSAMDIPRKVNTAVVVARMVPQKNCRFILDILRGASTIEKLVWYGDGVLRSEIEKLIISYGLENKVVLMGVRPRIEVLMALAMSDIYIAPSKWEGIGVANLEAAALGATPFLSTIPPHEEISNALGIDTYPLDNLTAWLTAISSYFAEDVVDRENRRKRVSKAVMAKYDLNSAVMEYISVYRMSY